MTTENQGSNLTNASSSPKRILFANAKGGCGKSTLATNLASSYAHLGVKTALLDYDPQGSAGQWLKRRGENLAQITGIEAYRLGNSGSTGNWFMRLPRDIDRIIVDTPAGIQGEDFHQQIRAADIIIVPVLPSPIDIHSATRFIGSILLSAEFRNSGKTLAVLANRARKNTKVLHKLDLFLNSLKLPRLGTIRDTQQYVHCSELGMGVVENPSSRNSQDRMAWQELIAWIEDNFGSSSDVIKLPISRQEEPVCPETKEGVYTVG